MINQISEIINSAENGDIGMLHALTDLEDIRIELDASLEFIKDWKDENIDELAMLKEDYPEGYGGYKIEYRSGGYTYKYDHIPEYKNLKIELKRIESEAKMSLSALEKGNTMVNDDGEIVPHAEKYGRKASLILKKI